MTTAIQDSYAFNAKLKNKGQQRNNDGWTITLDWRLPGSKFDLALYGQDWDDLNNLEVGDFTGVTISKGNLKQDKDGRYASDFFWDLDGFDAPVEPQPGDERPPGARMPTPPQEASHRGLQEPSSDDIQTRIQIGMAFNAAYTYISSLGNEWTMDQLRQLRDQIYHEVIKVTVAPAHYCYEHEAIRRPGSKTGAWGHLIDGNKEQPCFEVPPAVGEFLVDSQAIDEEQHGS